MKHPSKIKTSLVRSFKISVLMMFLSGTLALALMVLPSHSWATAAPAGNALNFASTQYVTCGTINLSGSALTLEAWIKPDSFQADSPYISFIAGEESDPNDANFRLGDVLVDNNKLQFNLRISGSMTDLSGNTGLTADVWTHVAATYDGSNMRLYINGIEDNSKAQTGAFTANGAFTISSVNRAFDGQIDEVRVWTVARTAAEIRANMYKELAGDESNLVAYYKMSNGSGISLTDNSSNSHSGTLTNTPTWDVSGAFSGPRNSLDFDGSNDYVSIPANDSLNNANFTVEFWMKMNDTPAWSSWDGIVDKGRYTGTQDWYFLTVWGQWEPSSILFGMPGTEIYMGLSLNKWYHVAATYDGTNVVAYVDGKQIGTTTVSSYTPSDNGIYLGRTFEASYYFNGGLDELRIWSDARTAAEIRDNMFRTLKGNEGNLVAYYRFDQTAASGQTTLYDLASNGNNGTLTNMDPSSDWVSSTAFNTWEGGDSTAWSTAANWSRSAAPETTDNVGLFAWTGVSGPTGSNVTISGTPTVNHMGVATGAAPTLSSGFTANGNLILNADFPVGANTVTIGGSTINTQDLSISTGTVDANGPFDATGGNVTFTGAGNLKLGSTVTSLGTLSTDNGTVWYDRAGAQTVLVDSYFSLNIAGGGSNTKTLAAGTTNVAGDLTVAASTTLAAGSNTLNATGTAKTSDINGTITISTGTVDADGTFDATGGSITFTGSGILKLASTVTSLGTLTAGSGTVTYDGTSGQAIPETNTFYNLTVNNSGGVTVNADSTVNNGLGLTNGIVTLGNNDLTLGATATVSGTPSASKMIVTNGTGVLKKLLSATGSFTFPVGDSTVTAEYSPATLNFTSGTFAGGAYASVNVANSKQPDNTSSTDYLKRYWSVTQSGISSFSCDTTFNYLAADVEGTEADIYGGQYKDSAWTVLNAVDTANNRFQATISSFSDFTGVEASTPSTQASSIGFSSVAQTQMAVSWTRGNGDKVLVVAHQGSAVDSNPVDGTGYTANAVFGSGTEIGTGNYVVYKGTGTSVTVAGLTAATAYHFRAYEFNDGGVEELYITGTATSNPNNQTTLPNAPSAPTATAATSITQTGFTANWNAASGATGYRLDVATNTGFTSYVLGYQNKDVGNVITSSVTGLTGGTTYYYRVRAVNTGGTGANSNTITAATLSLPTKVDLTGPSTATAGALSTVFTLTSQDADGDAANVTADTKFDLSSNSSGTKVFYSNSAGTAVITQVTISSGSSTATFYYKDSNSGTPTLTAAWNSGGTDLGSDTLQITVSLATPTLAVTTPASYDCSVTKVEMHNGTSWVAIFTGTAALDVVPGGTFPGVSDLSLPAGTYSQIRVTFTNSFPLKGSRSYGGATYYTTAATFGGRTNLASTPTTDSGSEAEFTFRIEAWGPINDPVEKTFDITPITVGPSTDYQPTLRLSISDKLLLKGTAGNPSTYYFALSEPTVSIVEP